MSYHKEWKKFINEGRGRDHSWGDEEDDDHPYAYKDPEEKEEVEEANKEEEEEEFEYMIDPKTARGHGPRGKGASPPRGKPSGRGKKKVKEAEDQPAPGEEGGRDKYRNDVEKVVKFLFYKSEQVAQYMDKIKGDKVESAQLVAHMLGELGLSVQEFNQLLPKVKQTMKNSAPDAGSVEEEVESAFRSRMETIVREELARLK